MLVGKSPRKWGEEWSTIEPITVSTVKDYQETHLNKYYQIMGEYPPESSTLTKISKCVPPKVYWSGAQHHINQMGLSTKLAV
eukprot:3356477-Karenia_brevis.AAC.1